MVFEKRRKLYFILTSPKQRENCLGRGLWYFELAASYLWNFPSDPLSNRCSAKSGHSLVPASQAPANYEADLDKFNFFTYKDAYTVALSILVTRVSKFLQSFSIILKIQI